MEGGAAAGADCGGGSSVQNVDRDKFEHSKAGGEGGWEGSRPVYS